MVRGVAEAQEYLRGQGLDGWLIHDFQGSNPVFAEVLGEAKHNTRPCFLLVRPAGDPVVLVHRVDAGKYRATGTEVRSFLSRRELVDGLAKLLHGRGRVAMEYSPNAELPAASRVDAGTVELVRGNGVEVVSSADLLQFALYRLSDADLAAHRAAATKLQQAAEEAFREIGARLTDGISELELCAFMRGRYDELGLTADDGPIVAVNEHSGDPHYEPTPATSRPIRRGDWVLLDCWAKETTGPGIYADITWVGYVGDAVPAEQGRVFEVVAGARDRAVDCLAAALKSGTPAAGWQVDRAAREYIEAAGYGPRFTHRLGHSLGRAVHASGANLDGFETKDTRPIGPGALVTVEPGIYLERFGVRSEIDVFVGAEGPVVTTARQTAPALIG